MPRLLNYSRIGLRTLFYVLVFTAFTVWLLSLYVGTTRPTSPAPTNGRVYPYDFHGKTVYLSKPEDFIVHSWTLVFFLCLVVGFGGKWLDTLERRRKLLSD